MKRELDPFESKLREKLQGKAQFPEDILWKRLNDELLRSDQKVASKNRYWILGAALLVFISLGTGYFIGMRQGASKLVTGKNIKDDRKTGINTKSQMSSIQNKNRNVQTEDVKFKLPETGQALKHETLFEIQMPVDHMNLAHTKKDHLSTFNGILANDSKNLPISITEQVTSSSTILTPEKINQDHFSSSQLLIASASKNIPLVQNTSDVINLRSNESTPLPIVSENDFILDKLFIQHVALLPTSKPTSLAKGTTYKKHLPTFMSTSLGIEPTAINRLQTNRIYGTGSNYALNEKGLHSTNLKFGFQAQLGRHLELGTGIGTFTYSTQQTLKNQIVEIDPLADNLNFESSISSFQIHEDHLFDDPEDQEENELNFEDSTSFNLNYQLSNTIKSFQVPVTAGFVFQVKKCKLTLKTGLIFNHMTQANQVVSISGFNAIRNDVKAQLISNSIYQLFQVGAEFPVSEHVSFMFAPSYSHALKSISKSSVLRPNSIGLECALKFYF